MTIVKPRGRLQLTVRDQSGAIVASRSATNMVVRDGAALVARLFSGANGALPVNQIQVGFATEAGTPELKTLTPRDDIPVGDLRSALKPENFTIDTTQSDSIQVSINAVFHPVRDLPDVTEAGLLAGDSLYNQVVFEPLSLKKDQEISFFWQINFPFGH